MSGCSNSNVSGDASMGSGNSIRFLGGFSKCQQRHYENIDSFVCVCTADSCDTIEPLGTLDKDNAVVYSTGIKADRLKRSKVPLTAISPQDVRVRVFPTKRFQKIFGFGGAITDASMVVLKDANPKLGKQLIRQYYGTDGLEYNLGRVPLSSCDFSTHVYSYLELENDWELKTFNFTEIDYYKAGFLRYIIKETDNKLRLFSSPWSAPAWMKESNSMLTGKLKTPYKYQQVYARYFLRFFEEYYKLGIRFWGTTVQNEPSGEYGWQAMLMSSEEQRIFVQKFLGPTLRANWLTKDIKIMAHDDARSGIEDAARTIYSKDHSFIDGLGVHWYSQSSFDVLNNTHYLQPDKFILASLWTFASRYAHDIIQSLRNHVIGWVDWNIWLDLFGGPNWYGNFVDAPIIVNLTSGGNEFYKQPMYYILGHFSKFIPSNSQRIGIKIDGYEGKESDHLEAVGVVTPENNYVVVLHNRDGEQSFDLVVGVDGQTEKFAKVQMPPKTIKTVIWNS
ncbi:Glucosylceramidase [Aphelenchoides besseyi]|nr:Glucosylceramidase [Aphelenchoides besseyi]